MAQKTRLAGLWSRFSLAVGLAVVAALSVQAGSAWAGGVTSDPLYINWRANYIGNDGNNYQTQLDVNRLSWDAVPVLNSFLYDYELTRDSTRIPLIRDRLNYELAHRLTNALGNTAWVTHASPPDPSSDGSEYPSDSARILCVFLHFADLVRRDPQLAAYQADADRYTAAAVDCYNRFHPHFLPLDQARGLGSEQCWPTYNPGGPANGSWWGMSMPHNKQSDYGLMLLGLWQVTGNVQYRDDAVAIAIAYKSQEYLNAAADANWGDYWDPAVAARDSGNRWDFPTNAGWKEYIWVEHSGGYTSIDMSFVAQMYDHGLVFSTEDVRRFVNSQLKLSWQGNHNPPTFNLCDGSPGNGYTGCLYPALVKYATLTPSGYPTLDSLLQELWNIYGRGTGWGDLETAPKYLLNAYGSAIPPLAAHVTPLTAGVNDWVYQNTNLMLANGGSRISLTVAVDNANGNSSYVVTLTQTGGQGVATYAPSSSDGTVVNIYGGARPTGNVPANFGSCALNVSLHGDQSGEDVGLGTVTINVRQLGDITGDQQVTASDRDLLNARLNDLDVGGTADRAFDLDCDGHVTTADRVRLNRVLNGLPLP